jgi:hypothetical protein
MEAQLLQSSHSVRISVFKQNLMLPVLLGRVIKVAVLIHIDLLIEKSSEKGRGVGEGKTLLRVFPSPTTFSF